MSSSVLSGRAVALIALFAVVITPVDRPASHATEGAETYDDLLAAVASEIPGFAGAVHAGPGMRVMLTTPSRSSALEARAVLSAKLGDPALRDRPVAAIAARYDFLQLHEWSVRARAFLSRDEVVFVDINEATKKIEVGSLDPGRTQRGRAFFVDNTDTPRDAIRFVQAEKIRQQTDLRDLHRPLVGGLQIGRSGWLCSLGFIAVRDGLTGFVTNSHCTERQGGVEATVLGQTTAAARIGVAEIDPLLFIGAPCPAQIRCRYSDAAWIRTDALVNSSRGRIALPELVGGAFWTWDGITTYSITARAAPMAGQGVSKVGRTTYRTDGTVDRTCVDVRVVDTNITMLCQSQASYDSQGGDSGAPVFTLTSSRGSVTLRGIHWGSSGTFSTIATIQRGDELGLLGVCTSSC